MRKFTENEIKALRTCYEESDNNWTFEEYLQEMEKLEDWEIDELIDYGSYWK